MKRATIALAMLFLLVADARPAAAQLGGLYDGLGAASGTIAATGTVTLERQPEVMRLQVDVMGKGSNPEAALAALDDRIAAARVQLAAFGADKDSIQVDEPRITESKTDRQKQMETMLAQRLRQSGRKKPAASEQVAVVATLTAEWKLQAKSSRELLLAVQPLQKKVVDADLAGVGEEKLSAEEQELMEEFGGYGGYGGDEEKPGTPVFLFAAPVPQADLNKATAEAFGKARAEAERLAAAAGAKLGPLAGISSHASPDTDYDGSLYGGYGSGLYRTMQRIESRNVSGDGPPEAVGALPQKIEYRVAVTAAFRIAE
ncbi:MAG: SIMPL domain-containing protein [Planctomycetales bacterium]